MMPVSDTSANHSVLFFCLIGYRLFSRSCVSDLYSDQMMVSAFYLAPFLGLWMAISWP